MVGVCLFLDEAYFILLLFELLHCLLLTIRSIAYFSWKV